MREEDTFELLCQRQVLTAARARLKRDLVREAGRPDRDPRTIRSMAEEIRECDSLLAGVGEQLRPFLH